MKPRDPVIYYSDEMIGSERVAGFSSFTKIEGDIFLGREPSHLDIKQTTIGDCYLSSAIKSIVRRNPNLIHEMIKERKGRIHVRLYYVSQKSGTFSEQWYAIDKSIVTHLVNKFGKGHEAPWVYLLEKAYALHRMRDPGFLLEARNANKDLNIDSTQNLDFSKILSSGYGYAALMALLGCQSNYWKIPNPNQSLVLLLKSNPEMLFDSKNPDNIEIISRLFKGHGNLLLYYSSLLINISFNSPTFELFKKNASELADKIQMGNVTQTEILQFFKINFKKLDKEFYHAIKLAVYQGIGAKLGDKRYSTEAIETYRKIHEKISCGELVTIDSKNIFIDNQNSEGLIPGHAYEVLNCYQSEGRCYIVISNPWQRVSRGYEVEQNTKKVIPIAYDVGFFHNASQIKDSQQHLHDIANSNVAYHPDVVLHESGTFELELNDCMDHFVSIDSTKINLSIKKYKKNCADIENRVNHYQIKIDRMSKNNSKSEIDINAQKDIEKIVKLRTEQAKILKLIEDLNQIKESVNFNPGLGLKK